MWCTSVNNEQQNMLETFFRASKYSFYHCSNKFISIKTTQDQWLNLVLDLGGVRQAQAIVQRMGDA